VGEFQRSSAEWWRIVIQSAALLANPLTVAVHCTKKPFIYAGFNNLMTDETQIWKRRNAGVFLFVYSLSGFHLCPSVANKLWPKQLNSN
jgi:hypothetical protein